MKKWLFLCMTVICCFYPMQSLAAEGSLRIVMPKEMEGQEVFCKQGENIAESAIVDSAGIAMFTDLTAGDYVIEIPSTEIYTFDELAIRLPMWQEEEHKMTYAVEAIPKYTRNIKKEIPPDTGDTLEGKVYIGLGMISLIIVAIMTCHNRFKCGKMSRKYSKRRRI